MPILQYFVFPPDIPIPASFAGKTARAGFRASAEGTQLVPPEPGRAELLVYEDRQPLTGAAAPAVAAELARLARQWAGLGVYADLEREPEAASLTFARTLEGLLSAQGQRLLLPEPYAARTPGDVVLRWQPSAGGFEAFLQEKRRRYDRPLWLESAPVCRRISLPWAADREQQISRDELDCLLQAQTLQDFENDRLLCRYALWRQEDGFTLLLWDTAQTLAKKEALADQYGLQGVVKLYPEAAEYAR